MLLDVTIMISYYVSYQFFPVDLSTDSLQFVPETTWKSALKLHTHHRWVLSHCCYNLNIFPVTTLLISSCSHGRLITILNWVSRLFEFSVEMSEEVNVGKINLGCCLSSCVFSCEIRTIIMPLVVLVQILREQSLNYVTGWDCCLLMKFMDVEAPRSIYIVLARSWCDFVFSNFTS